MSNNLTLDPTLEVDLVAYSGKNKDAITIQVKTNLKPKPGGGKGKLVSRHDHIGKEQALHLKDVVANKNGFVELWYEIRKE